MKFGISAKISLLTVILVMVTGVSVAILFYKETNSILIGLELKNIKHDVALQSILDAVKKGDFESARIMGHSIKGAGGGYGFHAVTDMGRAIEMAAADGDGATIKSNVSGIRDYLGQVEVVFE